MSNPVDPQTGDPESPESGSPERDSGAANEAASPEEGAPISPHEEQGTEGIVVEVETEEAETLESELESLRAKLAESEATAQQNHERMMRAAADLDNFRKRSRREVADARVDAQSRVLREILPVVDNLERAVSAAASATDTAGIREGVELVLRQFIQTLEKLSVVKVEAKGAPFDPNVHEAVSQMPTSEFPPGTVVEVLQPGYKIGDRLLRAALCVVASAPPAPPPAEDGAAEDSDGAGDGDSGASEPGAGSDAEE